MFGFLNRDNGAAASVATRDVVGCFGKMPVHADFIKHNVSTREVVALDGWIHDGVMLMSRKFGDDWKQVLESLPRYRFVWTGGEDERTLAGMILPGRDKSGRHYPFVVFAAMDYPEFKEMQAVVPLARADFFEALEQVTARNWEGAHLGVLTSTLDVAGQLCGEVCRRDLLDAEMSLLGDIRMGEFWNEILPGAGTETRAAFVRTLVSALHTVARRTPQRVHWGMRLPLPSRAEPSPYVVFWVQLCETILSGRRWHGQYFWNEAAPGFPPRVTVFFRPVPPSYFGNLVEPRKHDGSVLDVIHEMENEPGDVSAMRHIVEADDMLLVDALHHWRSREVLQ